MALGIKPAERGTCWTENGPVFLLAVAFVVLYRRGVWLSNLTYGLMSVLILMRTVGGYRTF